MAVAASDIKWYKSANGDSEGGTIDTNNEISDNVLNNLFADVGAGQIVYKKVFVKNTNGTYAANSPKLFFADFLTSQYVSLQMALGTADDTTPPTAWYEPTNIDQALQLNNLAPGDSQGIWLKLESVAYTYAVSNEGRTLELDFTS